MQDRPSVQSRLLDHLRMIFKVGTDAEKQEAEMWQKVLKSHQPQPAGGVQFATQKKPEGGK